MDSSESSSKPESGANLELTDNCLHKQSLISQRDEIHEQNTLNEDLIDFDLKFDTFNGKFDFTVGDSTEPKQLDNMNIESSLDPRGTDDSFCSDISPIDENKLILPEFNDNEVSFVYNVHFESVFDDKHYFPSLKHNVKDIVKFDDEDGQLVNHANIKALIVQLTSPDVIDYNLIYDFFITYRMFTNSETIMNYLLIRLIWSLQYINKPEQQSKKIGQLVLLRTFVVLRHWILNYFVDDFNSNLNLCDLFIKNMNQIVFNSNLVDEKMVFETKILKDLKFHWLNSIKEFWNVEVNLKQDDILQYSLPMTNEYSMTNFLKKSSTEMSIHTNPSYRRSAMLSLYDQKVHHKCLMFDDSKMKNLENPQLSINNLLVQHKSSRQSIMNKLNNFNLLKNKKDKSSAGSGSGPTSPVNLLNSSNEVLSPITNNVNNRMNLKDSSVVLRKTQKVHNEPSDKISLNPIQIDNIGFSTNGNIKLPTSRVEMIVPSTPCKKMEFGIRADNEDPDQSYDFADWEEPINSNLMDNVNVARKNSIKKILESWKKNSRHTNKSTEDLNKLINDSISDDIIGDRVDCLSARIIDELEFLIRNYIQNDSAYTHHTIAEGDSIDVTHNDTKEHLDIDDMEDSVDYMGSPANKYNITNEYPGSSMGGEEKHEDASTYENDQDLNDLSELNMSKIDNLINEESTQIHRSTNDVHEFSFQRPVSINWNDATELELDNSRKEENSGYLEDSSSELPEPNLPRDPSLEKGLSLAEPHAGFASNNGSRVSTLSTPSNITDYNAEIEDLGIAISPKSKNQQMKRISFGSINNGINTSKRFSRSSSNSLFKRDSIKSYISYDSAYSVSRESINVNGNLRKKAGVNNLRTLAGLPSERKSLENPVRIQSTSSLRKSIRTSAFLALSELPFSEGQDSRTSLNNNKVYRISGAGDSSIFSVAIRSRASIANSFQTLNESADQTNDSDDFAFGFRASGNGLSNSLKHSIAIPGISNNVLKELAAIPDESFHFNPIDIALDKLEGNQKQNEIYNNELNTSETTHVDDTQDILNEINNANTEDIIDTSSQKDFSSEMPLTPVDNNTNYVDDINSTSTPANKTTGQSDGTLDSTQLDEDNVDNIFIFSANYSAESGAPDNSKDTVIGPSKARSESPVYEIQSPRLILQNYNLNDNSLTVENIVNSDLHISFILSNNSVELSEHFTCIERDILQEIDWKELIELKWNKELTPVNSWLEIIVNDDYFNTNKGVNLVIARFNLMVNWIISEILLTKRLEERVQIVSRFIHIANNCLSLQNYSTLMQILLALTSEKINKLKTTWKNLPPGDILILKNLEELSSPIKNFINLRLSINRIQPSKGCIPFVGLYLSDLIFNTERPKFVNKEKQVVNFARFRTSVHIVKSLSQCIEWSSYYKLNTNNELLSKCLYIRSLDEDEMNYCLENVIEP